MKYSLFQTRFILNVTNMIYIHQSENLHKSFLKNHIFMIESDENDCIDNFINEIN